ncbi:MAG: hypothetical protein GWP08_11665 [Nitrospiraceae bacterium]|nr:hypothetical protein [Nitrospiraceae bacterium]
MRTLPLPYVSISSTLRAGCPSGWALSLVLVLVALGVPWLAPAAHAGGLAGSVQGQGLSVHSLPAAGIVGLCIVAVVCIIAGAFIIMRRED